MSDLTEVYQRILEYFNSVNDPELISKEIPDDPKHGSASSRAYGIRSDVARRILEMRDSIGGRFESVEQIFEVKGIGPDTRHDILVRFAQDNPKKRPSGVHSRPAEPQQEEAVPQGNEEVRGDKPVAPIGVGTRATPPPTGHTGRESPASLDAHRAGRSRIWDIADKLLPAAALLVGLIVGLNMNQQDGDQRPVIPNLTLPDSIRLNLDAVQLKLNPVEVAWPSTMPIAARFDSSATQTLLEPWLAAVMEREAILAHRDSLAVLLLAGITGGKDTVGATSTGLEQTARLNHHVNINVERDATGRQIITSVCTMEDVPVAQGTFPPGGDE